MNIYMNEAGKFYKAEKKAADGHAEIPIPTQEMFLACDGTPRSRDELNAIINHPHFNQPKAEDA